MGKSEYFKDLNNWQKARLLVKLVYLESENGKLARDFDTESQFARAALSIMNNIADYETSEKKINNAPQNNSSTKQLH